MTYAYLIFSQGDNWAPHALTKMSRGIKCLRMGVTLGRTVNLTTVVESDAAKYSLTRLGINFYGRYFIGPSRGIYRSPGVGMYA